MKNKIIPIPTNMQKLDLDVRGYPIPHIIQIDKNNKPHFTINDSVKVKNCVDHQLCAICAKPLGDDIWFSGGPLSAFHPNGAYIDGPTHKTCGYYALQVCPYLSATNYKHRIDAANVKPGDFDDAFLLIDPTMIPDRPPFFVFLKTTGYDVDLVTRYIQPNRPYLEIEYWKQGQTITEVEAQELINQFYK